MKGLQDKQTGKQAQTSSTHRTIDNRGLVNDILLLNLIQSSTLHARAYMSTWGRRSLPWVRDVSPPPHTLHGRGSIPTPGPIRLPWGMHIHLIWWIIISTIRGGHPPWHGAGKVSTPGWMLLFLNLQ